MARHFRLTDSNGIQLQQAVCGWLRQSNELFMPHIVTKDRANLLPHLWRVDEKTYEATEAFTHELQLKSEPWINDSSVNL